MRERSRREQRERSLMVSGGLIVTPPFKISSGCSSGNRTLGLAVLLTVPVALPQLLLVA